MADSYHASVHTMLEQTRADGKETAFERMVHQGHRCTYCEQGIRCSLCSQGPCRITAKASRGVCGIDADGMAMRNLPTVRGAPRSQSSAWGRGRRFRSDPSPGTQLLCRAGVWPDAASARSLGSRARTSGARVGGALSGVRPSRQRPPLPACPGAHSSPGTPSDAPRRSCR
jgi:hypothetical protein